MTNTILLNSVPSFLGTPGSSPTRSKPTAARNSPRGKQHDPLNEWEQNRVRFGHSTYVSPRGSPNGRSRRTPSKSPRQSPSYTDLYAGFSDSPAPAALPKPPSHWMIAALKLTNRSCHIEAIQNSPITTFVLNVRA